MAISPVSQVSFNSICFRGKDKNKENLNNIPQAPQRGSDLSKMPVVVLLTMLPNVVNPAESKLFSENPTPTVLVDSPGSAQQQKQYPFGWRSLGNLKFQQIHKTIINGHPHHLMLASYNNNSNVDVVYLVNDNIKGDSQRMGHTPPEVTGLIYHNLGPDKEFCGFRIEEDIYENDKYVGTKVSEKRVSDETAQIIIDLLQGDSYINATHIKFIENKSANLMPAKIY